VSRNDDCAVEGEGVGTADGAAVGVTSTVAMDCTDTTKFSPALSKLFCRAELKASGVSKLVTALKAVELPSSFAEATEAEGTVTTMLTETLDPSCRRPAEEVPAVLISMLLVMAKLVVAVITGSPT